MNIFSSFLFSPKPDVTIKFKEWDLSSVSTPLSNSDISEPVIAKFILKEQLIIARRRCLKGSKSKEDVMNRLENIVYTPSIDKPVDYTNIDNLRFNNYFGKLIFHAGCLSCVNPINNGISVCAGCCYYDRNINVDLSSVKV